MIRIAILMALLSTSVLAEGWNDQPPNVSAWFRSLKRPDSPYVSCCGESDAYEADSFEIEGDHYVAIITNGAGDEKHGRPPIPNGTRIAVPNTKMKWDEGNPTGHGVIFLRKYVGSPVAVFCYVTPGGI